MPHFHCVALRSAIALRKFFYIGFIPYSFHSRRIKLLCMRHIDCKGKSE